MHFNDRSSTLLCLCSWTFILSRSWTAKKSTPPTISLVEWIFFAVHERAFYGPLWTKSLAKSLFLVVHERLYGIVHQHAFIPRCWTHPNSLADYLRPCRPIRCDVWIVQRMRYRPTNRPTDQQTDTASYRGALSHLKMMIHQKRSFIQS